MVWCIGFWCSCRRGLPRGSRAHAGCKALVNAGYCVSGDEMGGEEVGARNPVDGCGGVKCGSNKTNDALEGCIHLKQKVVPGQLG